MMGNFSFLKIRKIQLNLSAMPEYGQRLIEVTQDSKKSSELFLYFKKSSPIAKRLRLVSEFFLARYWVHAIEVEDNTRDVHFVANVKAFATT